MKKLIEKYKNMSLQARAALWFMACSFMQRGISELTTPIFSRILTTAEFGQYKNFDTWMNFVTVIVVMKLYAGMYTQGLVKYEEDRKTYVSSLQGLSLTLCIIWTGIYWIWHDFWNELLSLTTVQMFAMMVMIWATACFNLWATEQRVMLKYRSLVIVTLLVSIAKPVVGIILVLNADDKVTARILGLALVEFIGYSAFFVIALVRGKKFYSSKYWKSTILLGLPLIPHYLSQTALNGADKIMIKRMVGDSESGIYSLAYSVSQIMTLVNTALVQTITPWIGQKIKQNKGEQVPGLVEGMLIIDAVCNLGVMAFAPELIAVFGPKKYAEAIWVMPPVVMSVYFSFAYSVFAAYEFYFEKNRLMSVATMTGAVLNIVLNLIFIDKFGYIAAGYTTLICYILYGLFHYFLMQSIIKNNMQKKDLFSTKRMGFITLLFLLAGFVYLASYLNTFVRYGLNGVLLILIIVFRKKLIKLIKNIFDIRRKKAGNVNRDK